MLFYKLLLFFISYSSYKSINKQQPNNPQAIDTHIKTSLGPPGIVHMPINVMSNMIKLIVIKMALTILRIFPITISPPKPHLK